MSLALCGIFAVCGRKGSRDGRLESVLGEVVNLEQDLRGGQDHTPRIGPFQKLLWGLRVPVAR